MNFIKGNWVDLVILLILLYFFLDSFRHNFFIILIEFLSFLTSLLLGIRFYNQLSNLLTVNFSIPSAISKSISFFIVVAITETIVATLLFLLLKKLPLYIKNLKALNYFRFIVGLLDGLLAISFLIPLVLAFPIPTFMKDSISSSKLGNLIYTNTISFEKNYKDIFGGVVDEGMNLLTVKPESDKSIPLHVASTNLTVDYQSENNMFNLVNLERKKAGVAQLKLRTDLVDIARNYAKDMWTRGYFSHYSPEGKNVANRLEDAGISFRIVGENLALAPTVLVAHSGLMNSQGHRENILNPEYRQIAIGVIDNKSYGKIFVQIFTD